MSQRFITLTNYHCPVNNPEQKYFHIAVDHITDLTIHYHLSNELRMQMHKTGFQWTPELLAQRETYTSVGMDVVGSAEDGQVCFAVTESPGVIRDLIRKAGMMA